MQVFFRLFRYVLRHKARLAFVFALAMVGVLVELARPWPVKFVVDHVLSDRPLPAAFGRLFDSLPAEGASARILVACVIAAILITVAGGVLALAVLNLTVHLAQQLVYDLSRDLFDKLQRLSLAYHGRHSVGDLLQRVSSDAFVVHFTVSQVLLPGVASSIVLVGMFVIMASIELSLAVIALAVVPLLALALALFTKPINDTTTRQWERQGSMMAFVEQSLSAIKAIQGFARETFIMSKLEHEAKELGQAYVDATRVSASYKEVTAMVTGIAAALLLGLGGWHVLSGRLSLGDLLIFLGYLTALYGPVHSLSSAVGYAVAVVARGRRVFEVLDSAEEVRNRPGAVFLHPVRGEIAFEGVGFGYHDAGGEARPVLHDISFHSAPGQITAIVGATGAGKSTLVSLMSRFYDPWQGRIRLDGHDVRDLTLQSLRENVSLVLQDPFLFPVSIADNIRFGRPDATREETVAAATAAQAHEFIQQLPRGYDTLVAQKGVSLSGGERQRIAIARAILKNAPILILDEPTSAVDARTETQIFGAISELIRDRTTFVISHRLTTIQRADQILVLDGGRIVERGTHQELLANGKVYSQLYKHQYIAYA